MLFKRSSDTHNEFIGLRYGGWAVGLGSTEYLQRIGGRNKNLVSWYNNKGYHSLPAYVNALHNAMLRSIAVNWTSTNAADKSTKEDACFACDYGITTFAEPIDLPESFFGLSRSLLQIISSYGTSLIMMIAFSFVPTSFISYLIGERQREEKQVPMIFIYFLYPLI